MSDRCDAVHVVVPDGIDDLTRPSGGNTYDRRLCRELAVRGWTVHEHAVPGFWTRPDAASFAGLADALQEIPVGCPVLLDGLIASRAAHVLVTESHRLRLVMLMHMPLGHRPPAECRDEVRRQERTALAACRAVVVPSTWARQRLMDLYELPDDQVHVAEPGTDSAECVPGSAAGGALLCVAAVSFEKGHDVLLDALEAISELSWQCQCVGRLDREPEFVDSLRQRAREHGLGERVSFPGPRSGTALDHVYASADVLVLASRAETYGMVITEALARGLPVIATDVGGSPEALGYGAGRSRPGLLVAPEDPAALGTALQLWLSDAELRARLRQAARERRTSLARWSSTALVVARVLSEVSR